MDEVWKEIPDWPQYEVSSLGKVRRGALIKTAYEDRKGYLKVKLWSHSSGKGILVHRLVAAAFIGPIGVGQVCRHRNGNHQDNSVENLCYGTRAENEADKITHGTAAIGEKHPAAKLTEAEVSEIRRRYKPYSVANGPTALAMEFGVTAALISAIARRKIWKDFT
ncbi:HNH endonuclease [Pseudomonas aeruginosa]|uniref:HNH endonuclease n=1 Tax=Pseudomonas aeruginosa TaxID=287 RepID=UPI003CC50E35